MSGSYHIGNGGGAGAITGWNGPHFGQWLFAQFQYVKEHNTRICGGLSATQWRVRPSSWQGGILTGVDVSSWDGCEGNGQGYCHQGAGNHADFPANAGFDRYWNQAADYGGSISAFGVSLGGHSTYSSNMKLSWHFGGNPHHALFGHDGSPGNNATVIYAA